MKTRLLFLCVVAMLFCSCDTIQLLEDNRYSFFIFRYADSANKELIITSQAGRQAAQTDSFGLGVINGIYNYPKRYRNEPYYGCERWTKKPEKYSFDICELATEEKVLALHDGYFTYFPYTNINTANEDVVRDGKWENLCDGSPLELPVAGNAGSLYREIRHFEIRPLEKITGKSRKEMTIEDIEEAINKLIDEGQLDKYSTKVSDIWGLQE